jgi:hypothetical protein
MLEMRFFWFTGEMEKQFPQYWKNDPEEGGKTYMKPNFDGTVKTFGTEHQDYFKITNMESGKKLAENFKGLKTMIWLPSCTTLSICFRMLRQRWMW